MSVSHDLLLHQGKRAACWREAAVCSGSVWVPDGKFLLPFMLKATSWSTHLRCLRVSLACMAWLSFMVQQGLNKRSCCISTLSPGVNTEIWCCGEKLQSASGFSTTLCSFSIFCTLFGWVLFLYSPTCNHLSVHLLWIYQIRLFSTSCLTDFYATGSKKKQ